MYYARRGLRGSLLILILSALLPLSGCANKVPMADDPLAGYALVATDATPPPEFEASPEPLDSWLELPLGESEIPVVVHPTRRPGLHTVESSVLIQRAHEREQADIARTGALQINVSAQSMAALYTVNDIDYTYFTDAADGCLHRTNSSGALGDEAVNTDRASGFIRDSNGALLYINDHRQIIRLSLNDEGQTSRELLLTMDNVNFLTRWDDTLYFTGGRGIAQGIYSIQPSGETNMIVTGAENVVIDSLNERLVVLHTRADNTSLLRSYALDGSDPYDIIEGGVQAFAYSGNRLYFSTDEAIYALDEDGSVLRILDTPAEWLGAYGGELFYLDALDMLHKCGLNGASPISPVEGMVYNLSFYDERMAYGTSLDAGIASTASITGY